MKIEPSGHTSEMIVAYGPVDCELPPLGYLQELQWRNAGGFLVRREAFPELPLLQVANIPRTREAVAEGEHLIMFYRLIKRVPEPRADAARPTPAPKRRGRPPKVRPE